MTNRLSQELVSQLIEGYRGGMRVTELARCYSVDRRNIYRIFDRLGVQKRDNLHKLTSEEIAEMASKYKSGVMLEALAEEYGVRVSTVYHHLKKLGLKFRKRGWDSRRMIYEENDVATGSV